MTDPCAYLPFELFTHILSFMDKYHLSRTSQVSVQWNSSSNNDMLWDRLCSSLWQDKLYVPEKFVKMKHDGSPKQAYKDSLQDYDRQYITVDELCKFTWCFRFKEAAGEHWVENDPWWHSKTPHRMMFFPDGGTKYLENKDQEIRLPRIERRWKFVSHAAGRTGPDGSFVQINSYPPYIISRYRGGFIMQSCWVVYSSFPLPPMGTCADLEDPALEITTETMSTEAMRYNIGVEFNLQDQGHIVNLLQLLAQIQHHNNLNFFNVNDYVVDDDDDEEEDADEDFEDGEEEGEGEGGEFEQGNEYHEGAEEESEAYMDDEYDAQEDSDNEAMEDID